MAERADIDVVAGVVGSPCDLGTVTGAGGLLGPPCIERGFACTRSASPTSKALSCSCGARCQMIRSRVVGRLQGPDLGIRTVPASLGAADTNARPHAASIKFDASVTGMVKAFIRIGSAMLSWTVREPLGN